MYSSLMAFGSSPNSNGWMAAPEQLEKPKEKIAAESRSSSSSGGWTTASVGGERKKLSGKWKEEKAIDESGNISSPDGWTVGEEGLNLSEKAFLSTEPSSSSPCREFVITAKAFKEMISGDPDKSVVLSDDFDDSAMEVSILVAGDDMHGSFKDILLMRYGFPSDKVIIRDRTDSPESLILDWCDIRQAAKLSIWQLIVELQTKSVRPFPFDYGEIHDNDCLDVAVQFVSQIGMALESLIINDYRGNVDDTLDLELEGDHYDDERLQILRSLLKEEDCGFAEIESLINMLEGVMEILRSNTTPPDLVSALRNLGESFRMIVQMLRQLCHKVTLETGMTWPVNWKDIEDTNGHFGILSLMIRDKVEQEKEVLASETAYKSKSNKIFAALVVMRNWLFYVEVETYRLVLALQSKISLQQLTSELKSLMERKQERLPFVVCSILAMHPVEEPGNGMRYLDEMTSFNITKSILHVVSQLDNILSTLGTPIASIISWEELVACEKSLLKVETELKEIESQMHAGEETTGNLMQKHEKALDKMWTLHGGAGTSLLSGTSFDGRRKDKGKAPMTADMEQNRQGRRGPRGPGIYINDPSEHQGDSYSHPTQFHKTRPQRRASQGRLK